jgi:hypothetical protein
VIYSGEIVDKVCHDITLEISLGLGDVVLSQVVSLRHNIASDSARAYSPLGFSQYFSRPVEA